MARSEAGRELTERHRRGQLAIRAAALQSFLRIAPLWRGDSATFQDLVAATEPLVRAHRQLSSAFSASYFRAFREAERVSGEATPVLAPSLDADKMRAGLIVTGEGAARRAQAAGRSIEASRASALAQMSGSITRQVLDGGRQTMAASSATDPQAQGWVRVTSGDPCAFCALIASRGPAFSEEGAQFEAHDHCTCSAEPSYAGSEWPGRAREFRQLYDSAAKGQTDPLNSFRRALSG